MAKEILEADNSKMVLNHRPVFFKIFNELSEKRLKIPPQFVRDLMKNASKRIDLEGPNGHRSSVKLLKNDEGEVFLRDSDWHKFVESNMLQEHNFLVFEYDNGERCLVVKIFGKNGLESNFTSALARTNEEIAISRIPDLNQLPAFSSSHPFFKAIIKGYNVRPPFLMMIPKSFAEQHLEKLKTKIMLKNLEGKEWEVNYTINNGGFVLVGGWPKFVRDNKLKIGDVCTFELVDEKVLRVNISDD